MGRSLERINAGWKDAGLTLVIEHAVQTGVSLFVIIMGRPIEQ